MRSLLFALLTGLLGVTQVYAADTPALPTFGDWAKKCETAKVKQKGEEQASEKEICYVFQNVSNKDNGQMIMQVRVGFAPDKSAPVLIVTLPLGALLPPGAGFLVEDGDPLKLPFLACGREGCTTVGQAIGSKTLKAMMRGDKAAVRVALLNQKVLTLPVSLKGFTRAYNSIRPK